MIYTVTINPALDYVVRGENIVLGEVNRVNGDTLQMGGKGINVSVVLSELGCKSKALGFIAGFTGEELERMVKSQGVETDFVKLNKGLTRINIKLKSGVETELNAKGPEITEKDIAKLIEKLSEIENGDTLVLSGSTAGLSDIYERILNSLSGKHIRTVVDTSGKQLTDVLKYHPWLIKPNLDELTELFGKRPENNDEVAELARRLQEMGAVNVLVSMAGKGAVLVDENDIVYYQPACKGKVVNSVGAGDSMTAGFIAGAAEGDYEAGLKLGTATGAATAFSEGLGTAEFIRELLGTLH